MPPCPSGSQQQPVWEQNGCSTRSGRAWLDTMSSTLPLFPPPVIQYWLKSDRKLTKWTTHACSQCSFCSLRGSDLTPSSSGVYKSSGRKWGHFLCVIRSCKPSNPIKTLRNSCHSRGSKEIERITSQLQCVARSTNTQSPVVTGHQARDTHSGGLTTL